MIRAIAIPAVLSTALLVAGASPREAYPVQYNSGDDRAETSAVATEAPIDETARDAVDGNPEMVLRTIAWTTTKNRCRKGFARALASELNDIQAVAPIRARRIGLGSINSKIACVVRHDSSHVGASATIVMRRGLSADDVRYALYDLDFGDPSYDVMEREGPVKPGGVKSVVRTTYGALTSRWRGENWRFRSHYPAETVVLLADLNIPHTLQKCDKNGYGPVEAPGWYLRGLPKPGAIVQSCRPWTTEEFKQYLDSSINQMIRRDARRPGRSCQDVTSFDYNWQNDMLCTKENGSRFYTDYEGAAEFLRG